MGEAKRRKELGLPPRENTTELALPKLDKESIKKKARTMLYENPVIPILFYGTLATAIVFGVFKLIKLYKLIY